MKYRNGFTLAETMVAVALVGAILALGMTNFGTLRARSQTRADAAEVANVLRVALGEAIRRGEEVRAYFGHGDGDVVLALAGPNCYTPGAVLHRVNVSSNIDTTGLPSDVLGFIPGQTLRAYRLSDCAVQLAAAGELVVTGYADETRRVELSALGVPRVTP